MCHMIISKKSCQQTKLNGTGRQDQFRRGEKGNICALQRIKGKVKVVAVQSSERKGKNLIQNVTNKPTVYNNLS